MTDELRNVFLLSIFKISDGMCAGLQGIVLYIDSCYGWKIWWNRPEFIKSTKFNDFFKGNELLLKKVFLFLLWAVIRPQKKIWILVHHFVWLAISDVYPIRKKIEQFVQNHFKSLNQMPKITETISSKCCSSSMPDAWHRTHDIFLGLIWLLLIHT